MKVTYNAEQKLFSIPCGKGFTCLGLEVCQSRIESLARELGERAMLNHDEPLAIYDEYLRVLELARVKNKQTGWRSQSELTPQLIGLEGRRIEVVDKYNEKRRFQVGKSTGFIPCHLEIARITSTGGGAVTGAPFKSLKIIR